jgi:hypothetical protein
MGEGRRGAVDREMDSPLFCACGPDPRFCLTSDKECSLRGHEEGERQREVCVSRPVSGVLQGLGCEHCAHSLTSPPSCVK